MASLHSLTVQDILWINLQTTQRVNHFNYARLEEATYYQYAYGESNSLLPQATRFVSGFLRMHPFDAGNEATALVAVAAFLVLNHAQLDLSDQEAESWILGITSKTSTLSRLGHVADHADHEISVREAINVALTRFSCTIKAFRERA
jgi:prophage maintenance system killer protein